MYTTVYNCSVPEPDAVLKIVKLERISFCCSLKTFNAYYVSKKKSL